MNKIKRFNLGLLIVSLLVGVVSFSLSTIQSKVSTPASAWSGTQTSNEGTYFSSVGSETGEALKTKLKNIISVGTSESYDWSRYEAADEAEGQSSKVLLIYSRRTDDKTNHVSGSTGWNREHSFAKSLFNNQAPAVNDNHHIFADDNKTNGERGNKPFNELDPASATRVIDGYGNITDNYSTTSYFMPNDLAKGEVARATMYMNTRYGYEVTLNFYSVELMLEWHLDHPVTNREVYRNNVVQSLQKNRNPYIDHQDWACKVYGGYNAATQQLCNQQQVDPTSVTISPSSGSVNMGSTLNLSASVLPSGANQSVTWETSNSAIATVSNGVVTPISVGQVTIRARSTVNTAIFGSATITVTNTSIPVTGISLTPTTLNLNVGSSGVITPTISPSNATNKNITWSSNNSSIATVNQSGSVTGVNAGNAIITATTSDGGFTDTVNVTINEVAPPTSSLDFTFDNTGNASWPITSGFISYYSTGFGIDTAGATMKSSQILSNVPVGSTYTISIAAVTNSASNYTTMTVYGLDYQGSRISGIYGSENSPSNSSGTLATQITFARNNVKTIVLPVSMTKKVFALEVSFSSSGNKTLLVDVNVGYSLANDSNQALAYANFVNQDLGNNASGSCLSMYQILTSEYGRLTSGAKALFDQGSSSEYTNARARIAYLANWTDANQTPGKPLGNLEGISSNLIAITIISLLSLSAILGYYYMNRKKKFN